MAGLVEDDWGWFTPEDIERLFSAFLQMPDKCSLVLVGGQAVVFWVEYFDVSIPKTDRPYLTQDADFYGTHEDAKQLSTLLGANIRLASMDDNTANIAVINYRGTAGKKLIIDVLGSVVGLTNQEREPRTTQPLKGGGICHSAATVLINGMARKGSNARGWWSSRHLLISIPF